ncbi:proteophosphoglycan ppg4 [Rhodotorula toruloides]|uniref:Proteophosphoglycan ppg4 n=1 Tax=Rhodotorula toruloides TaxID=5286 RepID=A0A511KFK4_RHOTO|nr:proteophosphoglycan ppg4 [Rhodotorula toruloides]
MSGESQDVPAMIARQDVSTAILGPYMAGLAVQLFLDGVYVALFLNYAHELNKHGKRGKWASWVVFISVLACVGLSIEEVFDTGVSQARDSASMYMGTPACNAEPLLAGLTGAVCQSFLMSRTGALIEKSWIRFAFYALVSSLVLLAFAGSVLFSVIGFLIVYGASVPMQIFTAEAVDLLLSLSLSLWLWGSSFADLIISAALAYTLTHRASGIAGFNSTTDSLVKRLVRVSLQTAAYTSIISLVGASLATHYQGVDDYHTEAIGFAFWLPLPALHAISLYTTLATRRNITDALSGSGGTPSHDQRKSGRFTSSKASGMAVKLSTFKVGGNSQRAPGFPNDSQIPLDVKVQREEHVSFDVGLDEEESLEGKMRRM